MGKYSGKCALCGKECELSFEHIPPRAAFNSSPQKIITGDTLINSIGDPNRKPWDCSGLHYVSEQMGSGLYSLCKECNSYTGTKYGNDYVDFARKVHSLLVRLNASPGNSLVIENAEIYPLRIMKQMVSMFCSVNKDIDSEEFSQMRKFVLDQNNKDFPKNSVKLGMYFLTNGLMKMCPYTVEVMSSGSGFETISLSEVASYPIGILMYFNPPSDFKMPCTDITEFADHDYDELCKVKLSAPIYETNIMFPADFRAKEEFD